MDDRTLIPAHVFYARWFVRIRWISILILLLAIFICKYVFNLKLELLPLLCITAVLLIINILHLLLLRRIARSDKENIVGAIKRGIHAQIIGDFMVLAAVLHYSGGIENPMIILFFLHMIISSSIFSKKESYFHSGLAIILIAFVTLMEAYGLIPHYPLGKPVLEGLYQEQINNS